MSKTLFIDTVRPDVKISGQKINRSWCVYPEASVDSYILSHSIFRKLREAMNAQKNAERAAMRAHFRRKYQLTKVSTHLIYMPV